MLTDQLSNYLGDGERPPTVQELAVPYVAPGRAAQLRVGILYQAPWKNPKDGMGRHSREQVRALAMTGLPLRLQAFATSVILQEELDPAASKLAYLEGVSFTHTAIAIRHLVFNTPELLREVICPSAVRSSTPEAVQRMMASTIIYTSWERDRVHPQYVEMLQDVGQIWVPCAANKRAFVNSGLSKEKVKIVPCPYAPEEHALAAPRGNEAVPKGKRFYHIGKWEPRKNQHQLIGAFLMAFSPRDKASLFMKISGFGLSSVNRLSQWANYPSPGESIQHWLNDPRVQQRGWAMPDVDRLIRIVDKSVSEEDLKQIHKTNNIYVSSGLGEAWDLPAFEAKLAGNRLVYVGFGGPEEYADPFDVRVPTSWQDVHSGYMWEPDAQWAKVNTEEFAVSLKRAEAPHERIVPEHFCSFFGQYAVANKMLDNIKELATHLNCWDLVRSSGGFG